MFNVPKTRYARMKTSLRKFTDILDQALKFDYNESDTITIVKDLLEEVFGYEKYADITSENRVRGIYCDISLKIKSEVKIIAEVKAAGITLKDRHIKQTVDYAVNMGLDWVILTNSIDWYVYHVEYKKPVAQKLVLKLNLLNMNLRTKESYNALYTLCKEGVMGDYLWIMTENKYVTSKFIFGAMLLHDPKVVALIQRKLYQIQKKKTMR